MLVFLSGEREIRDTADALRALDLPDTEVLPLYARLSTAEQHRVFQRHPGRRVVLATNVAETSLTVPGIRYVVDPGTARISRYSQRTKVQRLPIEPISQASANQRAGRCGRVADGICIRLYSEEDFDARPEFTDPEILRTNLASVILQMTALGLGDIEAFPFLDPPDRRGHRRRRAPARGARRRSTQGDAHALTPIGRSLARLPVDPRLGRMVLEAERAGLPARGAGHRRRPVDPGPPRAAGREAATAGRPAARPLQRRATATSSPSLNLWGYLREQQRELSRQPRSAGCAATSSSTTCASASGRTCTASCARSSPTLGMTPEPRATAEPDAGATGPCWPACSATSA